MAGGKVASTWEKGKKPPVSKPKGRKNNKTLIKEAIGVKSWKDLTKWVETKGIQKYIEEVNKLKGKDYIFGMSCIMEFVKPKLQRQTIVGDPVNPIQTKNEHRFIIVDMTEGTEKEL